MSMEKLNAWRMSSDVRQAFLLSIRPEAPD
jgi:hypothetical protein